VFLSTLFRDVLLRDRAPSAVAQSARNVALLRRAGLAAVAALCVIGGLWSTVQYVKNRRAVSTAREISAESTIGDDLPTFATLTQLDKVRTDLERLSTWRRWWFYKGTRLHPELRKVYQERFNSVLLGPARISLLKSLDSLPDSASAAGQYGRAYTHLKAYLMTTSEPGKLAADFAVPLLTERWINGRQIDPERMELGRRQFEFYASQLCRSSNCETVPEGRAVTRTRRFLGQFKGPERIYQLMVSDASMKNPGVHFSRRFPGAAGVVVDNYDVPGAFTERGWASMQGALRNSERFFQADDWVLGDRQGGGLDRAKLNADLNATYVADYIRAWRSFLTAASVVPYQSPKDAASKLGQLGSSQSPLLQLLSLVAENTNVDAASVKAAFQPVHVVVPPAAKNRVVVEANQPYVGALIRLQGAVGQTAAAEQWVTQTQDAARNAKEAVRQWQVSLKFSDTGSAGGVGARVQSLLEEPIDRVERLATRVPGSALNDRGAAFCRSLGAILGKSPMSPNSSVQATLSEFSSVFEPNTGALWRLCYEGLQNVLAKEGTRYVPKAGGVSPTSAFVRFFNRLAAVTDALWPAEATEPRFDFTLKLLPAEGASDPAFWMDGQIGRATGKRRLLVGPRASGAAQPYTWVGGEAGTVRLSAKVQGSVETLLEFKGTWALFQLLQQAKWETIGGKPIAQWVVNVRGRPVVLKAEMNLGAARPVVKGDYFVGMSCVSQVVQ